MRRKRNQHTILPEINVIPLIDVSLMLLVVFMITTPMLQQGIKLDLPKGQVQEIAQQKQEIVVSIDAHAKLFLNGKGLSSDALVAQLQKQISVDGQQTVFVKADRAVHYGKVIEVVDRIKLIPGVGYVALATQQA